ncbi:MAG: hypothetical protein ACRDZZ_12265 [Ilumatobacteraceae bacterium]
MKKALILVVVVMVVVVVLLGFPIPVTGGMACAECTAVVSPTSCIAAVLLAGFVLVLVALTSRADRPWRLLVDQFAGSALFRPPRFS